MSHLSMGRIDRTARNEHVHVGMSMHCSRVGGVSVRKIFFADGSRLVFNRTQIITMVVSVLFSILSDFS